MDLNFNLISIVHALGVVEGATLGIILLFSNRKIKSTLFLGLFLLVFAIEFLPLLIAELSARPHRAQFFLFTTTLSFLLFPLFFIYIQKISIFPNKKIQYWILYPGIASVVFQVLLYLTRDNTQEFLDQFYFFEIYLLLGLAYSLYILIQINSYIKQHNEEVHNQFASDKNRLLHWARFFAMIAFVLFAIRISSFFIEKIPYLQLTVSVLNIIAIGFVANCGLVQYNILSSVQETAAEKLPAETGNSQSTKKSMALLKRLDTYVMETEVFKKENISIMDVARAMDEHPRAVSNALNEYYNKTFNSYINEFRITMAIALLKENYIKQVSVEGLSKEVGFHSKTSFYKSFKKFTGTTPIAYYNELNRDVDNYS